MNFSRATLSYLRFRVDGDVPSVQEQRAFSKSIALRQFQDDAFEEDNRPNCGWVSLDHPFENALALTPEQYEFPSIIALQYREDRYNFPRELVAHRVEQRIQLLLADGEKISRQKRKMVEAAILAELRTQTLARYTLTPVFWDLQKKLVRISGTSKRSLETVPAYFEKTFSRRLIPLNYHVQASEIDLSERAQKVLQQLKAQNIFKHTPEKAHE